MEVKRLFIQLSVEKTEKRAGQLMRIANVYETEWLALDAKTKSKAKGHETMAIPKPQSVRKQPNTKLSV